MFHVTLQKNFSTWSAVPSNTLVQRLHAYFPEGSMRWIAVFALHGEEHRIALDSPDGSTGMSLRLPEWFLDTMGVTGEQIVRFERSESMPRATSLTFRLNSLPDWLDIRDILEGPLSQLGVIKQGQVLPLDVLDDTILLDNAEPFDTFLFLDGDEIAIHVICDAEPEPVPVVEPEPVPVPLPEPVPVPLPEPDDFSMIPMKKGFVPFTGKCHVIGSKPKDA